MKTKKMQFYTSSIVKWWECKIYVMIISKTVPLCNGGRDLRNTGKGTYIWGFLFVVFSVNKKYHSYIPTRQILCPKLCRGQRNRNGFRRMDGRKSARANDGMMTKANRLFCVVTDVCLIPSYPILVIKYSQQITSGKDWFWYRLMCSYVFLDRKASFSMEFRLSLASEQTTRKAVWPPRWTIHGISVWSVLIKLFGQRFIRRILRGGGEWCLIYSWCGTYIVLDSWNLIWIDFGNF